MTRREHQAVDASAERQAASVLADLPAVHQRSQEPPMGIAGGALGTTSIDPWAAPTRIPQKQERPGRW